MKTKELYKYFQICLMSGSLEYKWLIRKYISILIKDKNFDLQKKINNDLINSCKSNFYYINKYKNINDSSLNAIIKICNKYTFKLNEIKDNNLQKYGKIFNIISGSSRKIKCCYDCGTIARVIFYKLIKINRKKVYKDILNNNEKEYINNNFYFTRLSINDSLAELKKNFENIHDYGGLLLCALQLGENFGHTFVIEKKNVIRIYQSSFNAYLLSDYIEYMDYLEYPHKSMNWINFIEDLEIIFTKKWDNVNLNLFLKWFCFSPSKQIYDSSDKKNFMSIVINY